MRYDDADTSLSFLDVLTNGLGSLLVLLFLMAALRTADAGASGDEVARTDAEPFLILASAVPPTVLFDRPTAECWHVTGDLAFDTRARRDAGPRHALLYAERPPQPDAVIALHDLRADAVLKVEVYRGRERVHTAQRKPGGDGRLTLWPPGR
jgi:hypothetical protein